MKTPTEKKLKTKIRAWLIFFIVFLIASGLTAFPIEAELLFILNHISMSPQFIQDWISEIYIAVKQTNKDYPYLSYGTDWLAFAHIVIATAFIGPLKDPV